MAMHLEASIARYCDGMPTDSKSDAEGPPIVVQRMYEATLWLIPKAMRFPRAHRFTIGDRIVNHSLDLLETLASAAYSTQRELAADAKAVPGGVTAGQVGDWRIRLATASSTHRMDRVESTIVSQEEQKAT